jgi:hypothetical protein
MTLTVRHADIGRNKSNYRRSHQRSNSQAALMSFCGDDGQTSDNKLRTDQNAISPSRKPKRDSIGAVSDVDKLK